MGKIEVFVFFCVEIWDFVCFIGMFWVWLIDVVENGWNFLVVKLIVIDKWKFFGFNGVG